jgi:Fic family protein
VKGVEGKQKIVYTPPPPEKVMELLQNVEKFIQESDDSLSILIKCAILHYQFEAIHPFADGNGRIGRLIIPLMLFEKGILPQPLLYISAYFDSHLEQYYEGLLAVSQKSKWREWIKFFLTAIVEQATDTIRNIQRLRDLQRKYREILHKKNPSSNVIHLMEDLFANPYMTVPKAQKLLKVTYPAAKNAVMILVNAGILKPVKMTYTSKVFLAEEIEAALHVD